MYLQYNNITYLRGLPLCFFFVFFMELLFYILQLDEKRYGREGKTKPGAYQLTGARFFNPRIFFYNFYNM